MLNAWTDLRVSLGHSTKEFSEGNNGLLESSLLLLPAHRGLDGGFVPMVRRGESIFRILMLCLSK